VGAGDLNDCGNCRYVMGCEIYTEREGQDAPDVFLGNLPWGFYWADSLSTDKYDVFKMVAGNKRSCFAPSLIMHIKKRK